MNPITIPLKIKNGIIKSCEKRPVTLAQIDEMVANVEKKVNNSLKAEIQSKEVGEMVMEELSRVDEIAYVRFACVYRKFKDISNLVDFLGKFETMIKE